MTEHKQWTIVEPIPQRAPIDRIAHTLGVLPATAELLYRRGMQTPEAAERFLSLSDTSFYDPYLLCDMDAAVARIERAISQNEKITVYGDYDVDGVTSTAVLYLYLKERGAQVDYYIPLRLKEGYGIHEGAVQALCARGTRLVVTVDTGITANDEVAAFAARGVDVVITDHHACRLPLPEAVAVINPQREDNEYPFRCLAGVGVAFCLLCAMEQARARQKGEDFLSNLCALCDRYLDLVAIGTIADVMPLTDQNRLIVKWGLRRMEAAPRLGLQALLAACGSERTKRRITSSLVGFTVAPRVNAAGRMGDAAKGVELFIAQDEGTAHRIAQELCDLNRMRQNEENTIAREAFALIESEIDLEKDSVIVLAKEGWHSGIIGIVASRIAEHYHKPCILISIDGTVGKGSGRSVTGLHLVQALSACAPYLSQYGGHELAAGLTVEKEQIAEFRAALNEYAAAHLHTEDRIPTLQIDMELTPAEVTLEQAQQLDLLEPFGSKNPQPVFVLRAAQIAELSEIGGGKHTKMQLRCADKTLTALWFGVSAAELDYAVSDTVDVAFCLDVNEFMGARSVQLLIKDLGRSKKEQQRIARGIVDYYCLSQSSGALTCTAPVYTQFAQVYRTLKRKYGQSGQSFTLHKLQTLCEQECSWAQLRFILDVFCELGFFALAPLTDDPLYLAYRITWSETERKVRLEESALYRALLARKTPTPC